MVSCQFQIHSVVHEVLKGRRNMKIHLRIEDYQCLHSRPLNFIFAWVNVFRINPEFRILRLTFHRKSASKFFIREIIIASRINFQII